MQFFIGFHYINLRNSLYIFTEKFLLLDELSLQYNRNCNGFELSLGRDEASILFIMFPTLLRYFSESWHSEKVNLQILVFLL